MTRLSRSLILGLYKSDAKSLEALLEHCTPLTRKFAIDVDLVRVNEQLKNGPVIAFDKEGLLCFVQAEKGRNGTRRAVAEAVRKLEGDIGVDPMDCAHAAAEGAFLGSYDYKNKKQRSIQVMNSVVESQKEGLSWETGAVFANAQNLARKWMNTPANLLTPSVFADEAKSLLTVAGCEVAVHDKNWIQANSMNAFLSVAKGSEEEPKFVEATFKGRPGAADLVLVGKGITFDSGGISIKPSNGMAMMKGDMGGAAVVLATLKAIAELKLNLNVKALVPMCENMPSGTATKPGDVVVASNGKSIEIDNTDAEGRLILADALVYAQQHGKRVIDVATLTGAMDVALGSAMTGVFSNDQSLFNVLRECSLTVDDPVWQMPLHQVYDDQIKSDVADLRNVGGRGGGACTAASFLKAFIGETQSWAHLDIAGVMNNTATSGVNVKGMSGRPTRTLIEYARQLALKQE